MLYTLFDFQRLLFAKEHKSITFQFKSNQIKQFFGQTSIFVVSIKKKNL